MPSTTAQSYPVLSSPFAPSCLGESRDDTEERGRRVQGAGSGEEKGRRQERKGVVEEGKQGLS